MSAERVVDASSLVVGYAGTAVVHGLDLAVHHGEVVALVGGDGAGKTTVLRALSRRLAPLSGTLQLPDAREVGVMPARGAVFDDLTVTENLDFARAAHGRSPDGTRDRGELLVRMGLDGAVDRLAGRLSGGMRQKLGLAMALQHRPSVLLLDEPTTGVDPVSRAEIWRLLGEEVAAGTAVVMATTYIDEAARSSSVVVLDGGEALPQATPEEIRRRTPGLVVRGQAPRGPHAWRRGRLWHSWLPDSADRSGDAVEVDLEDAVIVAALRRGSGEPDTGFDIARPGRADRQAAPSGQGAGTPLRARAVTRRFGGFTAVDGVDVEVRPGEVVGLIGANGAGKTTLIRMLLGLLDPTAGTVELLGGPPSRRARRGVGYVAQGMGLYTDLTVAQQWEFHLRAFELPVRAGAPGGDGSWAEDARTLVGALSLGRQRRLAFDLAVSHGPALLVLDEPTSGVGPLGRARLWDRIHDAADGGAAILVTTHHLMEAEQCDRLVMMADGQVVAAGTVEEILAGHQALQITTDHPGRVLAVLAAEGIVASLVESGVAVPDPQVDAGRLAAVLRRADVAADVRRRPATLEERFVTLAAPAGRRPVPAGTAP